MAANSASSGRSTGVKRAPVLGSETPRIFTPPLRKLTPKTSLGFAAIEFAEDVCQVTLYPWQKWLLVHALELHPDGGFRFRTIVVLVARQQGKSMLSVILSLFFMYVLGRELVIGTAQDLDVAEEIWQEAVDLVEETPDLDALKERVVKVNGKKALELSSGERYKVKAANRRAGRGLSGELILLDELREHQSFDAWGAITKTTIARPDAQVWALSNAGDATSLVLRYLRQKAHAAIGDPDGIVGEEAPVVVDDEDFEDDTDESTLGIFEWSAKPGAHTKDREAWAMANPALGHGFVTERTLASAEATDPEWVFRTECLCQWSDGTLEGPFPPGSWDSGRFDADDPPQIVGNVMACVDMSQDRIKTYIAFAGRLADGTPQVEIVAERAGSEWVEGWLRERVGLIDSLTGQTRGAPVSSLMADLKAKLGNEIVVVDLQGSDLTGATGKFYDLVRESSLSHNPWPSLDLAAATAVPKLTEGGAFMWDRKRSPMDVAPLQAATGAVWLLTRTVEPKFTSAYADHDLIVI
ncbi:terminase large subunit domain-containing protein [Nocardioides terrigena]|uniref:terminase large subunit domain-containing protein n=1 Tax=Nocardioides terrigena TaxID=424797 RepID=UPI00131EDA35|nr:terminase large subunit [Nocardioides terrigena]